MLSYREEIIWTNPKSYFDMIHDFKILTYSDGKW